MEGLLKRCEGIIKNFSSVHDANAEQVSPLTAVEHELSHIVNESSALDLIPPEILIEIFLFCLPDLNSPPSFRQSLAAPLSLLRVCRRWNSIVLETPALWTHLRIAIHHTQQICKPPLPVLLEWLTRSSGCALTLDVHVHPRAAATFNVGDAAQVLRIPLSTYTRWKHARLTFPGLLQTASAVQHDILALSTTPAPLLESLSITLEGDETPFPGDPEFPTGVFNLDDILENAPRLQALTWIFQCKMPQFRPTSNWHRLTHIETAMCMSLLDCFTFLKDCPGLIACHFLRVERPWDGDACPSWLTLPSLRSLRIIAANVDFQPLVSLLTLPALRSLELSRSPVRGSQSMTMDSLASFTALHTFMLRSDAPLESLILHDLNIQDSHMVDFLKHFSDSLLDLDICESRGNITDQFLDLLTLAREESAEAVCPKLEVIKLRGGVISRDGKVLEMVKSRWRPPSLVKSNPPSERRGLTAVHVEFANHDGKHWKDLEGLRALRKQGLIARVF